MAYNPPVADNRGAARRSGRRWLLAVAALAVLGAVAAVVSLWHLPSQMYPGASDGAVQARAALQGGLLTAAAALTAVAGALIALDETRQANAETKRANEAADSRERAANANTHVREFYVSAINLLGSDTLDVRLGGLYALERIAVDSPDDQRTIVEVLSAYVREHVRPQLTPDPAAPVEVRRLPTDVQTALAILWRLPLHGNVARADLTRADLTGADLTRAQLDGVDLREANLTGARLDRANLTGARLDNADLTGADLIEAHLDRADLTRADLTRARLGRADLSRAVLIGARLTGADLADADLAEAQLRGADLSRADLTGANLAHARLDGVDMREAVGLEEGQVRVALGDVGTRLPAGVRRPESWGWHG